MQIKDIYIYKVYRELTHGIQAQMYGKAAVNNFDQYVRGLVTVSDDSPKISKQSQG